MQVSHLITVSPNPHEEVVRLDVSVNEVLVVDVLNPPNHLSRQSLKVFLMICLQLAPPRRDVTINSTKPYRKKNVRAPTWSANMRTVFIVNLLEQKLNKSSRLGPNSSITSQL